MPTVVEARRCFPLAALFAATVIGLGPGSVARADASKPSVDRAIHLFDTLEDERAARMLRALLQAPRPAAEVARIHVYLGLIAVNALHLDEARDEFHDARLADPDVKLPRKAPPKARQVFAEHITELAPKPAPIMPPPIEPVPPPLAPPPALILPPATPALVPPGASHVLPLTIGAIGLAGLGAGITFALLGQTALSHAQISPDVGTSQGFARQAANDRLTADVSYGVAAAAGITTVVLFLIGRAPDTQITAAVVPTGAGANFAIGGGF